MFLISFTLSDYGIHLFGFNAYSLKMLVFRKYSIIEIGQTQTFNNLSTRQTLPQCQLHQLNRRCELFRFVNSLSKERMR